MVQTRFVHQIRRDGGTQLVREINKINIVFKKDTKNMYTRSVVSPINKNLNRNLLRNSEEVIPSKITNEVIIAKDVSTASHHYWREEYTNVLFDIEKFGSFYKVTKQQYDQRHESGIVTTVRKYVSQGTNGDDIAGT